MKKCPKCNVEKDLLEFNSQKTRCLVCHRLASQQWRDNNLQKNRESQNQYTKYRRSKRDQRNHSKNHYERNKQAIIAKSAINSKERVEKSTLAIVDYLLKNPCVDCGETNPLKLSFDHVRGNKLFNIGESCRAGYSLDKIFKEVEKCDVRCFNCHMEKTAIQFNFMAYKVLVKKNYYIKK